MAPNTTSNADYVLGRTVAEHERLRRQGRLISGITRHFLEEIGLIPGMRVLDVGSGLGDVALLAARVVGPSGEVVCVDSDGAAMTVARERAADERLSNIRFHVGDLYQYQPSVAYDAVVGRCVLLHHGDSLATLETVLRYVRQNGTVAFQEPCFSLAFSRPHAPLFHEMLGWVHGVLTASGLDGDIGARLPSLFVSAGLPRPRLVFEMLVDGGAESEIYELCADTVRSLLPRIEELGIGTAETIQVATLADRLRQEASSFDTVIGIMPLIGAWTTKS